jgi:hypothetical protein
MVAISMASAALILLTATGCTSRQVYDTGQSYQRNRCERLLDQAERQRCLERAGTTYDDYKQETERKSGK